MELRYVIGMDTEHQAPPTGTPAPARPIYVVAAHPNWRESRVNRRLLQAAPGVHAGHRVATLFPVNCYLIDSCLRNIYGV